MELKERIIFTGWEIFFKYGVRSTTLDQLATELGISKKTIYLHFKDKNELVLAIVKHAMKIEREKANEVFEKSKDPINEILLATKVMRDMLSTINPTLLSDLEKYYPKAWKVFFESKMGFLVDIERNLRQGIERGYYRKELNVPVLARMRIENIETALNQVIFPFRDFSIHEIQLTFLDHFIRGIVSEKGLEVYQNYLNENNF